MENILLYEVTIILSVICLSPIIAYKILQNRARFEVPEYRPVPVQIHTYPEQNSLYKSKEVFYPIKNLKKLKRYRHYLKLIADYKNDSEYNPEIAINEIIFLAEKALGKKK